MTDEVKLWAAIILATVTKWLLTETGPSDGETPRQKRQRQRQAIGAILAGILIAYYGHERVIAFFPSFFTADDNIIVAILLGFTGEHFVRALISAGPTLVEKLINRLLGGSS